MVLLQSTDVSWGPAHLKSCLGLCCAVNLSLGLRCALFTHVTEYHLSIRFVGHCHDPSVHLSKHRHPAAVS